MKSILFHIGPPKTATTSLQYYFKNLKDERLKYLGIFQPREINNQKNKNSLVNLIYSYLKDGNNAKKINILQKVNLLFVEYDYLIVSEEMILGGLNWEVKLQKLNDLFKTYNLNILLCLRNIKNALPSYYGEIYNNLSIEMRKDFNVFEHSKYALIYDYDYLFKKLKIFDNVFFIEFEKLINNEYYEQDILIGFSNNKNRVIISKENYKERLYQTDNAKITINVNKTKQSITANRLYRSLSIIFVNRIPTSISKFFEYQKTISISFSNKMLEINKNNLSILKKLK